MFYVSRHLRSQQEAAAFVQMCDENFEYRLWKLVHSIVYDCVPKVITLAGPTCSGKTTTARKLTEEISSARKKAMVLSIDDFFHERISEKLVRTDVDFDSVAAIDLAYLAACTESMLAGKSTTLPRFDFLTGKRGASYEYVSTPDDIIIFEGIQAVYPEVTALLSAYDYKSIFINVNDDITVDGVRFSKSEVRLARRLVRDYRFRSASPEFTMGIWENVRRNEENNIFPYAKNSDYVINSLQPYEIYMIGQFVIPLLDTVPQASPHFEEAVGLADKFRAVRGCEINPVCLSPNSLYHEFLG